MLKDRYFYPLAITVIIGMVWFALAQTTDKPVSKTSVSENEIAAQEKPSGKLRD